MTCSSGFVWATVGDGVRVHACGGEIAPLVGVHHSHNLVLGGTLVVGGPVAASSVDPVASLLTSHPTLLSFLCPSSLVPSASQCDVALNLLLLGLFGIVVLPASVLLRLVPFACLLHIHYYYSYKTLFAFACMLFVFLCKVNGTGMVHFHAGHDPTAQLSARGGVAGRAPLWRGVVPGVSREHFASAAALVDTAR